MDVPLFTRYNIHSVAVVWREVKILGRQNDFWINQKIAGFFELQWNLELNDSLF